MGRSSRLLGATSMPSSFLPQDGTHDIHFKRARQIKTKRTPGSRSSGFSKILHSTLRKFSLVSPYCFVTHVPSNHWLLVYGGLPYLFADFYWNAGYYTFAFENTVYVGPGACLDHKAMLCAAFSIWLYQSGWWYEKSLGSFWLHLSRNSEYESLCSSWNHREHLLVLQRAKGKGWTLSNFHPDEQYCIVAVHLLNRDRNLKNSEVIDLYEYFAQDYLLSGIAQN